MPKEESKYVEKKLYDAICDNCNKKVKVPFQPDLNRPVYCNDCFTKMKKPSLIKPSKVSLLYLKPRPADTAKKHRKTVDAEGLKKILEETIK